jgi:hypothetical protein
MLIVYFPVGPTFRNRVVYSILKNIESYSLFDILIMTDFKEDPIFNSLREFTNIIIKDIDELRKDYPWSIEYEKLPVKTTNEKEYALDITKNEKLISSSIWRFAFCLPEIEKYDAILFCNCDIECKANIDTFNNIKNDFNLLTKDTVIGNGGYDFTDQFSSIANIIIKENNYTQLNPKLYSNDGNFFCYSFKNKNNIKNFLDILNNIIYQILVNNREDLFFLGRHGIWSLNNEPIQSIAYSILGIDVLPNILSINTGFSVFTFPEDRFWNWSQGDFICTLESKEEFIKINYERLKSFYINRGQFWNYN